MPTLISPARLAGTLEVPLKTWTGQEAPMWRGFLNSVSVRAWLLTFVLVGMTGAIAFATLASQSRP